jgi:hypothetical protein
VVERRQNVEPTIVQPSVSRVAREPVANSGAANRTTAVHSARPRAVRNIARQHRIEGPEMRKFVALAATSFVVVAAVAMVASEAEAGCVDEGL